MVDLSRMENKLTRPAAQTTPVSVEKEGGEVSECKIDGVTHLRRMANEGQPTLELRLAGGGACRAAWQTNRMHLPHRRAP